LLDHPPVIQSVPHRHPQPHGVHGGKVRNHGCGPREDSPGRPEGGEGVVAHVLHPIAVADLLSLTTQIHPPGQPSTPATNGMKKYRYVIVSSQGASLDFHRGPADLPGLFQKMWYAFSLVLLEKEVAEEPSQEK